MAAVANVLLVGVLVATLLIVGFLIVNLGMLSKRREDRIGRRDPSDVPVLKSQVWPEEDDRSPTLPAVDDREIELYESQTGVTRASEGSVPAYEDSEEKLAESKSATTGKQGQSHAA